MSSLKDIQRQLKSVQNIKKITITMERIAAARLRHAHPRAEHAQPYLHQLKKIIDYLKEEQISHPLLEQRQTKKIGLLVIAGDKGLSGSYNANVFKAADEFLKKYASSEVELILFGKKTVDHFQKKKWPILDKTEQWAKKISTKDVQKYSDTLVQWFLSKQLDEIWIIYTKYISLTYREVTVEKFLNLDLPQSSSSQNRFSFILEPTLTSILNFLLPKYCFSKIQMALYQSYATELAARLIAMQQASKNSEELIGNLTLLKNKIRQAGITREMLEIISGAESLK